MLINDLIYPIFFTLTAVLYTVYWCYCKFKTDHKKDKRIRTVLIILIIIPFIIDILN